MQPSQLDLQLAWSFREFPIVWEELEALGVRLTDVERAWARHLAMRRGAREPATLQEHIAFYGVEPRQEANADGSIRLRWPLALWPEYELAGLAIPGVGVFEEGLRFRDPPNVALIDAPFTLEQARDAIRLGVDTEAELAATLGPGDPDDGNGWSPDALFTYTLADGRTLQCLAIHGIVVELTAIDATPTLVDEPRMTSARPRRWWEFWKPAALRGAAAIAAMGVLTSCARPVRSGERAAAVDTSHVRISADPRALADALAPPALVLLDGLPLSDRAARDSIAALRPADVLEAYIVNASDCLRADHRCPVLVIYRRRSAKDR